MKNNPNKATIEEMTIISLMLIRFIIPILHETSIYLAESEARAKRYICLPK